MYSIVAQNYHSHSLTTAIVPDSVIRARHLGRATPSWNCTFVCPKLWLEFHKFRFGLYIEWNIYLCIRRKLQLWGTLYQMDLSSSRYCLQFWSFKFMGEDKQGKKCPKKAIQISDRQFPFAITWLTQRCSNQRRNFLYKIWHEITFWYKTRTITGT